MLQPFYPLEKQPVRIVQDAWWATGWVCAEAEILTPTGVWSPDCTACSMSLYWLCYPRCLYIYI